MLQNEQEPLVFAPVATQRVSREIARQIQSAIISGKLKPGDKLPSERELISMFGRSRPTIREAFRVLEESGMVSIVSGVGAIVCEPNLKQLIEPLDVILQMRKVTSSELIEMRIMVELSNIKWACERRTDKDLRSLEEILERELLYIDDWNMFYNVDRDFHETIAVAAKNRLSEVLLIVLREAMLTVVKKGFERLDEQGKRREQTELLEGHRKLYKAIKNHDVHTASECMQGHLNQFRQLIDQEERMEY